MRRYQKKKTDAEAESAETASGPVGRPFWSGTITFGLVSIPVDLFSAVRQRETAMKLVDDEGHALGREYRCSKEGTRLSNDDLVRGYETEDGKMIEITDEEIESVAPEMSSDINLQNFVPVDQIPALYFQKSYFLSPAGKSSKAYTLLAKTMERTKRVGIGSFVMRDHEYLVAIVSDNGVLRADTLRYADEIRSPETIGLPKHTKASAKLVSQFSKAIDDLIKTKLDVSELKDDYADALQKLVTAKKKDKANIIHQAHLESEDEPEASPASAQVIDIMELLRRSLSKRAVVTNAERSAPISLDARRSQKQEAVRVLEAKAKPRSASKAKARPKPKARQKSKSKAE